MSQTDGFLLEIVHFLYMYLSLEAYRKFSYNVKQSRAESLYKSVFYKEDIGVPKILLYGKAFNCKGDAWYVTW